MQRVSSDFPGLRFDSESRSGRLGLEYLQFQHPLYAPVGSLRRESQNERKLIRGQAAMLQNRLERETILEVQLAIERIVFRSQRLGNVNRPTLNPLDAVLPELEGGTVNALALSIQRVEEQMLGFLRKTEKAFHTAYPGIARRHRRKLEPKAG